MKLLVTGAEGMLGRAVVAAMDGVGPVRGVDLADGDLTDPEVVRRLVDAGPVEWVVHCAAWTDVDGAESRREESLAANAGATANLVAVCADRGLGLTAISTDYVFAGTAGTGYAEDDPRDPVNHYGATKARAEEAVAASPAPWQILRTSWLFGDGRTNFVKTIRRLLGERETLTVVDDQRGCPTYADDLAAVIGFLVTMRARGIFHGTNGGACTWYEFAREIARLSGADPERVRPCPSSAYPTPAARPACSVLRSANLEAAGCPPRPDWRDAVARYVARLDAGDVVHP